MISRPFLLAATIKNHLTKAGTPIAQQIAKNIYVDNMITGVDISTQADGLTKKPRPSSNLHQWIFVSGLQTPLKFSTMWSNQCRNYKSPRYHFHQRISQSLLRSEHNKKHCTPSADFKTHWVRFLQLWMRSCSFRNCENKKKIGTRHSVGHSTKNGASYVRAWLHYPLIHYPDIL